MTSEDRGARAAHPAISAWTAAIAIALGTQLLRPHLGSSHLVPSPSVLALLVGVVLGQLRFARERCAPGTKGVTKGAIPIAIVLIGFGLDLGPLVRSSTLLAGVLVTVGLMLVAFAGAALGARVLGLGPRTALLLGAGTAVCGNSAILAVAPAIEADDEEVGLSIGVINLLGVLMLFVLPPVAGAVGLDAREGGTLAGLTVHAVPQAIATGGTFGDAGLEWATLYKLLRVALLVPVVLLVTLLWPRQAGGAGRRPRVPLFVLLFVAAAGARALGVVDAQVALLGEDLPVWGWARLLGKLFLGIALAAIGLGLDARKLIRVGPRVLVAGVLSVAPMVAVGLLGARWLS